MNSPKGSNPNHYGAIAASHDGAEYGTRALFTRALFYWHANYEYGKRHGNTVLGVNGAR